MPDQPPNLPVVLELASLPREQSGPFVLLGLSKTATQEEIEANWAQRIIWARKKTTKVPLEDINWAKETLTDPGKRIEADAGSLNFDTSDGALQRLEEKYQNSDMRIGAQPIDEEKNLADYSPPVEIPDIEEIRATIKVPEIPREFPIVRKLMEEFAKEPLDPWKINIPIT